MEVPLANIGNLVSAEGGELELSAPRFCSFQEEHCRREYSLQILSIALEAREQLVGIAIS